MIKIKNIGKTDKYVYDISLDGTIVNALGLNIAKQTDGFNFKLPETYRYTKENPYIGKGLSRETVKGKEYVGYEADVAEFNDMYMCDMHYSDKAVNKMGLGIDEVLASSCNISRKNYLDYFPEKPYPSDVKIVGNTLKSKKLPAYIQKFFDKAFRLLLNNKGQEFLEEYYSYIDRIYNYNIPLQDIASKGKVKKRVKEYIADCNTITKAGRPKSRQAWMELVIKEGINVDLGETIYYINTGKSKSHADVKKVTHYYEIDADDNKKDIVTLVEKEFKKYKKEQQDLGNKKIMDKDEFIAERFPNVKVEEEIVLNCKLLPREMIESEEGYMCDGTFEYNVPKYIEQFNNRVTPLLVCFSKDIRSKILITNPSDRPYFTKEESRLVSGEPNNPSDQDTYEQLMTMEDKEIRFWKAHPEFEIPFLKECGMDWNKIVSDYDTRMKEEKKMGIDVIREEYNKAITKISSEEYNKILEEGVLPASLTKIIEVDPSTGNFVSKAHKEIVIGNVYDIIDAMSNSEMSDAI